MKQLLQLLDLLAKLAERIGLIIVGISGGTALLCLGYQVITRAFFPHFSVLWTAEIARICMVIATFSGGAVCLKRGDLVAMTFLSDKIPGLAGRFYQVLLHLAALAFLGIFVHQGVQCIPVYQAIKSLSLPMDLAWVVCLIVLGGALMFVEELALLLHSVDQLLHGPEKLDAEGGVSE